MLPASSLEERVCCAIRDVQRAHHHAHRKGRVGGRHWPEPVPTTILIKPFSPRESSRACALLRRALTLPRPSPSSRSDFGRPGHRHLWLQGRAVEGREVDHGSEFKAHHACTLSRSRLHRMELVEEGPWLRLRGLRKRTIDFTSRTCALLGDDPRNPRWFHTVHGVGYRFEVPRADDKAKARYGQSRVEASVASHEPRQRR